MKKYYEVLTADELRESAEDAGLCTLFGILKKNRTCWTPLKTWRRWRNTTDLDMGGLTWYKVRTI